MAKKNDGLILSICIFLGGLLLGLVSVYLFLNWAQPTGWILDAKGIDTKYLKYKEYLLIQKLLKNGNLFTQSDILSNFVAYYHTLMSILVTIILFLSGFVTYSFYRSRKEYNELMERELKLLLKEYKHMMVETDFTGKESENFEELKEWLQNQVMLVAKQTETTLFNEESEAALADILSESVLTRILNDEEFVRRVKESVLNQVDPDGPEEGE
jgi:hypothetical protein